MQNLGEDLELDNIEQAIARRDGRRGQAVADHRPHPHRDRQRRTSRTPAEAHGSPLGEEEIRLTKQRLRLARATSRSSCPTRRSSTSAQLRRARRAARGRVAERADAYGERAPRAAGRVRAHRPPPSCPRAGTPTCRASRPARSRWRRARRRDQVIQWAAGAGARAGRRLGRPRAVDAHADRGRRQRRGRRLRGAQPALRHPRARRWARSSTASRCTSFRGYGATFLIFSRLHEGRRSGWRR